MIQLLVYDTRLYNTYSNTKYKISRFDEFEDLNNFETNIIDLSNEYIWRFLGRIPASVNCFLGLIKIRDAIKYCKESKIIIILPQNIEFIYNCVGIRYESRLYLKNIIFYMTKIIDEKVIPLGTINFNFEENITNINGQYIKSDFYFINTEKRIFKDLTFSNNKRVTTIKSENVFLTTLDILDSKGTILNNFIELYCKILEEENEIPEWIKEILMKSKK